MIAFTGQIFVHSIQSLHFDSILEPVILSGAFVSKLVSLNLGPCSGVTSKQFFPIHPNPAKFANRGFSPTDLLTEYLSTETTLPYRKDLIRTVSKNTREHTEKEIEKWYSIKSEGIQHIKGNYILLLDDVSTRGYTLKACSQALLESGAKKISCLILGRTGG